MRSWIAAAVALLALVGAARAETLDTDLAPGEEVRSTLFPASERETFRVTAPAGSTLRLLPRALENPGAWTPELHYDLPSDDSAVVRLESESRKGLRFVFQHDGTFEFEVGASSGGGDYSLKSALKTPKRLALVGTVAAESPTTAAFFAPAGALATVTVKRGAGGTLVPRIAALEGPTGGAEPGAVKSGATADAWKKAPLGEAGAWDCVVGGDAGTTGDFTGTVKLRLPKATVRDVREISAPGSVEGAWSALLAAPAAGESGAPALLTGTLAFDGRGGIEASLATLVPTPDETSPLGFTLAEAPLEGASGTYRTDGVTAYLSLDLGAATPFDLALNLSGNARVLYPGEAAAPGTFALLLLRGAAPTKANLAGPFFYVDTLPGGDGTTLEVEGGTLSLSSGGGASGLGARSTVDLAGGGSGSPGAVLRTGSFDVDGAGAITVTTTRNIFGATDAWTVAPYFGLDILADASGLADLAAGGTVLLRQGTGLTNADATGSYLHFGMALGGTLALRTGTLEFDGEGGVTGTESSLDLGGGEVGLPVAVTGAYSVNAQGLATFALDGDAAGSGVVGPNADYFFTFALGESGVGLDFLLKLD